LPWLQRYSKEIVLVTTAVIASSVTSRSAISQEEADELLGDEPPLERLTRKIVAIWLITAGNTLKGLLFVDKQFREEVGNQLLLIGHLIDNYSIKKE
jgi:hypothetical protein